MTIPQADEIAVLRRELTAAQDEIARLKRIATAWATMLVDAGRVLHEASQVAPDGFLIHPGVISADQAGVAISQLDEMRAELERIAREGL